MIENYELIAPGHWFQIKNTGPTPDYSSSYSKNSYDKYDMTDHMSKLRYDLIKQNTNEFNSVCDFGYGNGSFMRYCQQNGLITYGYDISDYPVPPNTVKIDDINSINVDVMTFFDSIEHLAIPNLTPFISNIKVKYVCISVPWCHEYLGPEYFKKWKHRRENEHFHHFDLHGIISLLNDSNYKVLYVGNNEDKIRKPIDIHPNILTVIAQKK